MRAAKQLVAARDAEARVEGEVSDHWVPNERYVRVKEQQIHEDHPRTGLTQVRS